MHKTIGTRVKAFFATRFPNAFEKGDGPVFDPHSARLLRDASILYAISPASASCRVRELNRRISSKPKA